MRGLSLAAVLAITSASASAQTGAAATSVKEKDSKPRSVSEAEAYALAIYAPRPAYPYAARDKRLTGSGIVLVNVDSSTGTVVSAQMLKSTGYKALDDSALEAFRQWRFKPGTVRKVRIPINFVMRGSPGYGEYLRAVGHSLWLQNATY